MPSLTADRSEIIAAFNDASPDNRTMRAVRGLEHDCFVQAIAVSAKGGSNERAPTRVSVHLLVTTGTGDHPESSCQHEIDSLDFAGTHHTDECGEEAL